MLESTQVNGHCDSRFAAVRDAFADNFAHGLEVGASVAVTIDGSPVVDLWAGHADSRAATPWRDDTIVNVFSTTKIMTALCVLLLVDRGLINLDAAVAEYWPEFADNDKGQIPVRWLLCHTAGLPGFDEPLPVEALYEWERITRLLARQKPWWQPGTDSGYHSITFGYLLGELVRRVTGQTIGSFFRDELARPLAADFHIGLSAEDDPRAGELIAPPPLEPWPSDDTSLASRALLNPPVSPELTRQRAWRAAEIPATNGHGNARSAALVGSLLACNGTLAGRRFLSAEIVAEALSEQHYGTDLVLGLPIRWGLGVGLAGTAIAYPSPRTAYWGGVGGSWLVIDPDARMCFSYVMNKMVNDSIHDPRTVALREALFAAL
jgi:CubicO group peptidase (beta-lactamase class C family)